MFLSEWREFPLAPCLAGKRKTLHDSSRLDVVKIAGVPDMRPSLFPFWSGLGLISTPVLSLRGEELLAPRPTPTVEDRVLSNVAMLCYVM